LGRLPGFGAIKRWLDGGKMRHRLAVAGDEKFFAEGNLIEQTAQLVFGLK